MLHVTYAINVSSCCLQVESVTSNKPYNAIIFLYSGPGLPGDAGGAHGTVLPHNMMPNAVVKELKERGSSTGQVRS